MSIEPDRRLIDPERVDAALAEMTDTAVSQALRLLRAHGLVTTRRDGRIVRYSLADATVHELIHHVRPHPES